MSRRFFPGTKKSRVTNARGLEVPRSECQHRRNGGFTLRGFIPGNGRVVDPAYTVTSRSKMRPVFETAGISRAVGF